MTGYKNFLTQKEVKLKSDSVLNVSNGSSKPKEFSIKDNEMLVDIDEQNWFKRAHVGKFLGIEDIRSSSNDLGKSEMFTRQELIPSQRGTPGWSTPKDQQNKTDKFLAAIEVINVIVNSKNNIGRVLKDHILKGIVSKIFL